MPFRCVRVKVYVISCKVLNYYFQMLTYHQVNVTLSLLVRLFSFPGFVSSSSAAINTSMPYFCVALLCQFDGARGTGTFKDKSVFFFLATFPGFATGRWHLLRLCCFGTSRIFHSVFTFFS